jgi:hypothetical protein
MGLQYWASPDDALFQIFEVLQSPLNRSHLMEEVLTFADDTGEIVERESRNEGNQL